MVWCYDTFRLWSGELHSYPYWVDMAQLYPDTFDPTDYGDNKDDGNDGDDTAKSGKSGESKTKKTEESSAGGLLDSVLGVGDAVAVDDRALEKQRITTDDEEERKQRISTDDEDTQC